MKLIIDFLEFDEVLQQLKDHAAQVHPDKTFVPFWKIYLDGNEVVFRATVSDGKVGPQESVELRRELSEEEA